MASHIDPVKLRTSLVYSEIYTYVSESQVKYPHCTYHAQNLLIITRHIAKERERVYAERRTSFRDAQSLQRLPAEVIASPQVHYVKH